MISQHEAPDKAVSQTAPALQPSWALAEVSIFCHATASAPMMASTVLRVLERMRGPTFCRPVEKVRQYPHGSPQYTRLKQQLPAVTLAGSFQPTRANRHLVQHSGLVHFDADQVEALSERRAAIQADPHTAYCFLSTGGEGLKFGVEVGVLPDAAHYTYAWGIVAAYYQERYSLTIDRSGADIARLCFVTYDPDLYVNLQAQRFDIPPMPPPKPTPPIPPRPIRPVATRQDYGARAIETAVQMIQSAPLGTRHHARLKASRLLGGYIGSSLLAEERAYGALAQALVGYTEDLVQALKTVEDGLRYGQAQPITLEQLEAERQDWLAAHGQRNETRKGCSHAPLLGARYLVRGVPR